MAMIVNSIFSTINSSGFKTSDQVQGQGVRPIRRRPPTSVRLWRDKSVKRSIQAIIVSNGHSS
jgi:hypothetical protein